MVPYTSGKFDLHVSFSYFFGSVFEYIYCNKYQILTNSNQQPQSYKCNSHITEMLKICIQTSYDQNVQLILKSYLPVVYGTPFRKAWGYQRGNQMQYI